MYISCFSENKSRQKVVLIASKSVETLDFKGFQTYAIIPTRQVETRSKLFCIDRLIPFGFI